jgi:PPK2 family polyphosphate:nucleotide phosphotransferase
MVDSPYLVRPGKKFNLESLPTDDTGPFKSREEAAVPTQKLQKRLSELQEKLYASSQQALLVIFQAMDTGGKDGSIEHVFSSVDPQGCSVSSFKVPTPLERAHDFLWRHHCACPPKGIIGIHNRSHYEAVLVERVHSLAPESVWSTRYDRINDFERNLAAEGTTIVKFFLHISKKEQKERLQARLDDPVKHWKFNIGDLAERKHWDDYQQAYEDAMRKCSTKEGPWYVIPADRKWYRNYAMSAIMVDVLENMNPKFPPATADLSKVVVE